ncbi:MAG: radical SAM protein [Deltaproteobacteria bacterium]|nr:radical SAM protein [Deltaproteobacteria bacterium]
MNKSSGESLKQDRQINLEVSLGKACNNRCLFCANGIVPPADRQWTPREVVKDEIERGLGEGCTSLGFLGGEPTLYPWLEEVVDYARRIGYSRVALCTNGTRLAVNELARKMVDSGVTRLAISIHSRNGMLEDRLTGRPGSFKQKMDGLVQALNLDSLGLLEHGLALESVLVAPVLPDLPGYCKFFSDMGVRDFRFNVMRPEGKTAEDKSMVPCMREVGEALGELFIYNLESLNRKITFGDLPLCILPPHILADMSLLLPCLGERRDMETHVAVLRSQTGLVDRFLWTARKKDRLKTKPGFCMSCSLYDYCEGIWLRYLSLYGDSDFVPIP